MRISKRFQKSVSFKERGIIDDLFRITKDVNHVWHLSLIYYDW